MGTRSTPVPDRNAYDLYIESPGWQALRAAALLRDGHRCRCCDAAADLEVHHRRYPPFGRWDLDDVDALTTLCGACHGCVTSELRARRYAARARPGLRDVVRLTPILEAGDARGRLPFVDISDHRRVTPAPS